MYRKMYHGKAYDPRNFGPPYGLKDWEGPLLSKKGASDSGKGTSDSSKWTSDSGKGASDSGKGTSLPGKSASDCGKDTFTDGKDSPVEGRPSISYGPLRAVLRWRSRDRRFWAWRFPELADAEEKKEKEKEKKEKEKERVPDEKVDKLETLTVKEVDLHIADNAKQHRTDRYAITRPRDPEEEPQPDEELNEPHAVLRRGQEFKVTVSFNRAYDKEKDDLIFILDADEDTPNNKLKTRFKLTEDGTTPYKEEGQWGATIVKEQGRKQKLELSVYIPGNVVVGEWGLKVKTKLQGSEETYKYEHPTPIIVLFNPWSTEDQVHFTEDKTLLDEYVLNDCGTVYTGCTDFIGSRAWTYGQFDGGMLLTSLTILRRAFDFNMSVNMGDAVTVSRALSRIINACDDNGVLVGNWSGDYSGGVGPTSWKSSVKILQQYQETGQPVKFGQCWVFSHVLTAVCRALGLPCRSVTNFDSAHDADLTCTIDHYFTEDGEKVEGMASDSIWNFHVWNEVWLMRPDYPDVDGWQVIDATPQEQSYGVYQCGPCPVKAVKRGDVNARFDARFVFGEVNADVVHWTAGPDGQFNTHTSVQKDRVGHKISTKPPDGKPFSKAVSWYNCDDPTLRYDLTNEYKFPEGSEEEREATTKAIRLSRLGKKMFQQHTDLEVWFDKDIHPMVGEDVVLTSHVKNASKDDRNVSAAFTVGTAPYWNRSRNDKHITRETLAAKVIKAGEEESFSITVPADVYLSCCDESLSMYGFACAKDLQTNVPYTAEFPFRVRRPDLDVTEPMTTTSGEVVTVTASFTNPGSIPLTNCTFNMEGNLKVAKDDTNKLEFEPLYWKDYGSWNMAVGDVKEKETFKVTLRLVGRLAADQDQASKNMSMMFTCDQIKAGVHGSFSLQLTRAVAGR